MKTSDDQDRLFLIELYLCTGYGWKSSVENVQNKNSRIKLSKYSLIGFGNNFFAYLFASISEGSVEPLLKGGHRVEDVGQEEVKKGPQLGQFVLQWGSCRVCIILKCQSLFRTVNTS